MARSDRGCDTVELSDGSDDNCFTSDTKGASSSAASKGPLAQTDLAEYMRRVRALYAGSGAVILGNVLEWYDWTIYGYMEDLMSDLFFEGMDSATWLVFAVPFIARPLGSVLLGWVGDTMGRTVSLNMAIWGMAGSTVLQGCLVPGTAGAGVALALLRIVSGLSAGGEAAGVNTYMTEKGGADRDDTLVAAVAVNNVSGTLAFIFANFVALAMHQLPRTEQRSWAWRLPFLLAAPVGLASVWMRRGMQETEAFESLKVAKHAVCKGEDGTSSASEDEGDDEEGIEEASSETEDLEVAAGEDLAAPCGSRGGGNGCNTGGCAGAGSCVDGASVSDGGTQEECNEKGRALEDVTCFSYCRAIALVVVVITAISSCNYFPIYLAAWLQKRCHFPAGISLGVSAASKLTQLLMTWPVSVAGDRYGATATMLAGGLASAASLLPAMLLTLAAAGDGDEAPSGSAYAVAFVVLGTLLPMMITFYNIPCMLYMTSLFPPQVRGRGAGMGLGLASLGGGFTPVICTMLARQTDWLPALFVTLLALPSLVAILWSRRAARNGDLQIFQRPLLF